MTYNTPPALESIASNDLSREYSPSRSALFASVAEEEAEFLQTLGEDVLRRHVGIDR